MASRRHGMTLIEVLGALVILSMLLVGIIAAKSRLVRQMTRAENKASAIQAADKLLTTWWKDKDHLPRQATGQIEGAGNFNWRTSIVPSDKTAVLGAQLIALEILDPEATNHSLVRIEFMLPIPAATTRSDQ